MKSGTHKHSFVHEYTSKVKNSFFKKANSITEDRSTCSNEAIVLKYMESEEVRQETNTCAYN